MYAATFWVAVEIPDEPYVVEVGVIEHEGRAVPVTVHVLRTERVATGPPKPVSAREMRRLPIDTCLHMARAALQAHIQARAEAKATVQPTSVRSRNLRAELLRAVGPARGRKFYPVLLRTWDKLAAQGHPSPAKVIAEWFDVDPNVVHQWRYRARHVYKVDQPKAKPRGKGKR